MFVYIQSKTVGWLGIVNLSSFDIEIDFVTFFYQKRYFIDRIHISGVMKFEKIHVFIG